MAVSLNAVMTAGNQTDTHSGSGTTLTATSTITVAAGSNRAAYVTLGFGPSLVTGVTVTWGGNSMTQVGSTGDSGYTSAIFALADDSLLGTTPTIVASWTTSTDVYMSAIVFNGVQQSANGINASNTVQDQADDLTIDVTGTSDGATICTHIRDGGEPTTVGTGHTKFWGYDALTPGGAGAYRVGLTGTNAYDFNSGSTGTVRASVGINVVAAAGGGAAAINTLMLMGIGS